MTLRRSRRRAGRAMVEGKWIDPVAGGARAREHDPVTTAWVGWVMFAGVIMLTIGCFNAVAGIVALTNSDYYLVTSNRLLVHVDYTAWGWTLLIYGVVVGLAGAGVLVGQVWARAVGVLLAVVNAL